MYEYSEVFVISPCIVTLFSNQQIILSISFSEISNGSVFGVEDLLKTSELWKLINEWIEFLILPEKNNKQRKNILFQNIIYYLSSFHNSDSLQKILLDLWD